MAERERERILFSYKEIVECLIKEKNIHEGIWGISIGFDFGAANVMKPDEEDNFMPAAIVPITGIGIERMDEESNLTVDAAEVNPKPKSKKTKAKVKKTK
ncbi:MAG: hypothetical protein ACR2MD_07695 [Aridibacter sp.]|jgi:hypothetical protein